MFKKLLLTTITFSNLIHAADAFTSERFLGIEAGYGEVKSISAIEQNEVTQGIEFGFRFGAQNSEWRTTISGHNFNKDNHRYFRGMLQFDRFVWASLYETDDIVFKPYLGAHIGWLSYESSGGIKDDSLVYGAQTGLAWNVMREVDFDFGYRYSVSDVPNVDNLGGFVFAVNYLY